MIDNNGFIADGVYDEFPRFWYDNNKTSSRLMDISLFHYLYREKFICRDNTDRFFVTEKGRDFALPWYRKIFS